MGAVNRQLARRSREAVRLLATRTGTIVAVAAAVALLLAPPFIERLAGSHDPDFWRLHALAVAILGARFRARGVGVGVVGVLALVVPLEVWPLEATLGHEPVARGAALNMVALSVTASLIVGTLAALLTRSETVRRDAEAHLRAAEASREALREAEERYRLLIEQVAAVIYIVARDDDSTAQYISPRIEALTGYSADEWLGESGIWQRLLHPDDRERVVAEHLRVNQTGDPFVLEYRLVRKDGEVVWVRDESSLVPGDDGGPGRWQGIIVDMSASKRIEAALRENERQLRMAEARYRTLVEEMPAIIYINGWDEPHPMNYVSPHAEEMLGYPASAWTDAPGFVYSIVHAEDRERLRAENDRTEASGERFSLEYRLVASDGRVVWVRDECVPVHDGDGQPLFYQGIMIDITERRQAEAALRDSEERFRSAFDDAAIAMGIADLDGRLQRVNQPHCELLGYTEDELLGINIRDVIHPDDILTTSQRREDLLAGVIRSYKEERRYIHKDGHIVWGLVSLSLTRDSDGNPTNILAQVQDITDRKLAEEALRESEEYFRGAFDDAGIAMGVAGLDLRLLRVNEPHCAMLGYSEDELLALDHASLIHPDDREATERWRIDLLAGRTGAFQSERRYLHKDGHVVWGLVNISLVNDSEGHPKYVLSQIQDITERKQMEASLRQSEELFRGAFDFSTVGMSLSTPSGRYIRVNQAFCDMLGYSEPELLAMSYDAITYPDDLAENQEQRRKLLAGELDHFQIEKRYRHADGRPVWALLSVAIVRGGDGPPLFVIGQAQDISARKQLEAQLTHQAFHDHLTGLPNRALFIDRIGHALARARRHDLRVAVMFLDLDGFKAVNDTWGHAAGDQLLIAIGHRLQGWTRVDDTVARLGGDEFTVLLDDVRSEEEAIQIAERIIDGLAAPAVVGGQTVWVRASVGVAFNTPPEIAADDLLRNADIALYRAKRAGGNRHVVHRAGEPEPEIRAGELRATYS